MGPRSNDSSREKGTSALVGVLVKTYKKLICL